MSKFSEEMLQSVIFSSEYRHIGENIIYEHCRHNSNCDRNGRRMRYSSLKSSENSSAANSIVKLRELFSCFESLSSLVSDNEVEL